MVAILAATAAVAGCKVAPCDEFATAFDRRPSECPAKYTASQMVPPPPGQPNPSAPRYCYSNLAEVECYTSPQPGRTGYVGAYAPTIVPSAGTIITTPAAPSTAAPGSASVGKP